MIYITGDTHGGFNHIEKFCCGERYEALLQQGTLIILGDTGINYYGDKRDDVLKKRLTSLPVVLFCIHGNHENRPQNIEGYVQKVCYGGIVYAQPEYPGILFAKDGEIYSFDSKQYMVIGGAYSVDKYYRLASGNKWFEDEQPSARAKKLIENTLIERDHKIHGFLTHTCPIQYEPIEMFLPSIDQNKVDKSTEQWLGSIEEKTDYNIWYCGHYHTDKSVDKMRFLFKSIVKLE